MECKVSWLHIYRTVGFISANDAFHSSKRLICIQSFAHHACTTRLWGGYVKKRVLIGAAWGCLRMHSCSAPPPASHHVLLLCAWWLQCISLSSHGDLYDNLPRITVLGEWQREVGREGERVKRATGWKRKKKIIEMEKKKKNAGSWEEAKAATHEQSIWKSKGQAFPFQRREESGGRWLVSTWSSGTQRRLSSRRWRAGAPTSPTAEGLGRTG